MKTTTTYPKVLAFVALMASWLKTENSLMSTIVGQPVSNLSFIGTLAFSIFASFSLVLCTSFYSEYGWAAFLALLSINCAQPLFREIKKGGI